METDVTNPCGDYIAEKLKPLMPVFGRAALGDFSSTIDIPEDDNGFTELYIGIQVMLEVIREQLGQLYEFNLSLETKIKERNDELEAAYRREREHDRTVRELQERFAFVAAHELRAPMTDMNIGFSFLLEDTGFIEKLPGKYREILKRLGTKNKMLMQLLQDLLDVAQLKSENKSYPLAKVPLDMLFAETAKETGTLAMEQHITVTFPDPADLPSVTGNYIGLKEVLVNLVSNAIRYNKTGGWVTVGIELRPAEAVIHVKDNGIGITEDEKKKLFTQFYRARNEATKHIDGTGLGLFISREILKRMHGTIWVDSTPGEGSMFSFAVPLYPIS